MRELVLENPHKQIVQDILQAHLSEGMIASVFGSRANNTYKKYADLDLVLERADGSSIALTLILDLKASFEESDLPFKVDVVALNDLPEGFKNEIKKHKIYLYSY